MPLTAAERRARIRSRLRQAEEPEGTVEETTATMTEPVPEQEPEREQPHMVHRKVQVPNPVPRTATSQRSSKPPNYKLHVLTALSLAVLIRVARYGTKALTG